MHQHHRHGGKGEVGQHEHQEVHQHRRHALLLHGVHGHEGRERQEDQRHHDGEDVGRQHEPAERPVTGAEQHVPVFPDGLERAEHPTGPLREQGVDVVGGLGVGQGLVVLREPPARCVHGQRQVAVLRQRDVRVAAHGQDRLRPPGRARAGDDGDRAHLVLGSAIDADLGEVLERLPPRQQVALAVADRHHAGHRTEVARAVEREVPHQARHGGRRQDGVGIERDDVASGGVAQAVVESPRLALVGLRHQDHAAVGLLQAAHDGGGAVGGAIVDHDHLADGEVGGQDRTKRPGDHALLVVGGQQDGHLEVHLGGSGPPYARAAPMTAYGQPRIDGVDEHHTEDSEEEQRADQEVGPHEHHLHSLQAHLVPEVGLHGGHPSSQVRLDLRHGLERVAVRLRVGDQPADVVDGHALARCHHRRAAAW